MRNLVIVESGAKATKITEYLDKNFPEQQWEVAACLGHIRDLPDDESAVNPFDLWEGASFRLKMRNVEGFRNYDKSEFDSPGPLFDDDAKLEEVWKSEHSLQEQIDPSQFKSYDELKSRLYRVLALDGGPQTPVATAEDEIVDNSVAPAPQVDAVDSAEDDDESLSFFKKLAD